MKSDAKGTPQESEWGFNNDGKSTNTFGPSVKSTPNKVEATEAISNKSGNGGTYESNIFSSINYTKLVEDESKANFNSVDKSIFSKPDYSYTTEGLPGPENNGVFGSPSFAAKEKNAKVNGAI